MEEDAFFLFLQPLIFLLLRDCKHSVSFFWFIEDLNCSVVIGDDMDGTEEKSDVDFGFTFFGVVTFDETNPVFPSLHLVQYQTSGIFFLFTLAHLM